MICEVCSNHHEGTYGSGRFCSMPCARRFSSLAKRAEINKIVSLKLMGHTTKVKGHTYEEVFPNFCVAYKKAISEGRMKGYINLWKEGKVTGCNKHLHLLRSVKEYIFKKFNNQCAECGWNRLNPFTNKSTLQIHHKDGDRTNSKEDNLILLCPNCHSLTFNFSKTKVYELPKSTLS